MDRHVVNHIFGAFPGHFGRPSLRPPQGILVASLLLVVVIVCPLVLGVVDPGAPVEAAPGAAAEIRGAEVAVLAGFEGGRGGGRASRVPAQLDVRLRGLDVVDHGAELVDEPHQGHVHVLADGLAGDGEVAVEGVVVALVQVVEGKGVGGVVRGAHGFLHHHGANAERLQHQSWFEFQRREIDSSLPKERKGTSYYSAAFYESESQICFLHSLHLIY